MGQVRGQRCEGCWRNCRYSDFRGQVPTKKGARGSGLWRTFSEVGSDQQARLTDAIAEGKEGGVTRHTILGEIHEEKQRWWGKLTEECQHNGEPGPLTTDDAIRYVLAVSATDFRVDELGWTYDRARSYRKGVSLKEFWEWWSREHPELPLLYNPYPSDWDR